MLEFPRAVAELCTVPFSMPGLLGLPSGDGHGVLVIPGLMGDRASTSVLRGFLSAKGYRPRDWGLGRNMGVARNGGFDALLRTVDAVYEETGRKISIIGWSLGGVYANRLAKAVPHKIRQVFALGSPLAGEMVSPTTYSPALGRWTTTIEQNVVPRTVIFSRTDGVVPPQSASVDNHLTSETIEVIGSHAGLCVNPQVMFILATKLAQPEGEWKRLFGA